MATATILGFLILAGVLGRRQKTIQQGLPDDEEEVRNAFDGPHDRFTKGSEALRIDGGGYPLLHAQGAPSERNAAAAVFIYPNSKESAHINKDFFNWKNCGVIDKAKQLTQINEKITMEETTPLLDYQYKQLYGRTTTYQPKWRAKTSIMVD